MVAESIQTRLLLQDLSREADMSAVELYRVFQVSQESLRFPTLRSIINAVILYGDLLPSFEAMRLHPLTRELLSRIKEASCPFSPELRSNDNPVEFGMQWVKALCRALLPFLPPPGEGVATRSVSQTSGELPLFPPRGYPPGLTSRFAPLNGPQPPSLFEPRSPVSSLVGQGQSTGAERNRSTSSFQEEQLDKETTEVLCGLCAAVQKASGQDVTWQDMRSDLVEQKLGSKPFDSGPIQGSPIDGHQVGVKVGDQVSQGEIFDCALPLSNDLPAYEKLVKEALPVTQALKKSLYPNIQDLPKTMRMKTSGAIDSARLPLCLTNTTLFRSYRVQKRLSSKGRAVLLLACDGSASLDRNQMMMTKMLACAWMNATVKHDIEVLAGLYHSGSVRDGAPSGPLVRWIYHPRKTRSIGRRDAARALVSLPEAGTGSQSDALSIKFMLEESFGFARGSMVYLILISDCQWNRCLKGSMDGQQEVQLVLSSYSENLHSTLVGVGVQGETGFEKILHKVIKVSRSSLTDYAGVARQVSDYVASCIGEGKRQPRKGQAR